MDWKKALTRQNLVRVALGVLVVLLASVVVLRLVRRSENPYTFERLTEEVTLVCRETGEELVMPRGRMEQMLWDRPGPLDPSQGLQNPSTGRFTMFPKSEWEQTIERMNADRSAVAGRSRNSD